MQNIMTYIKSSSKVESNIYSKDPGVIKCIPHTVAANHHDVWYNIHILGCIA